MTVLAKVASLNLPSQVRGRKSRLFPHPKRTNTAVRLWNHHGIEIVSLQELATMSRATIRAHPRWGLASTTNDVFPARKVGNGVAWRKDRWQLVDRDTIHVDSRTHPKRGLRFPIVLLRNRDEPNVLLAVVAVHVPTLVAAKLATGSDRKATALRQRINQQVRVWGEAIASVHIPVIVAGDFNDGNVRDVYADWLLGAQNTVDQILGYGVGLRFTGRDADESVHWTVTDHHAMPFCTARLTVPRHPIDRDSLPKP